MMIRIMWFPTVVLFAVSCNYNALSPNGDGAKTHYIDGARPNASDANDGLSDGDGFAMFLGSGGNRFLKNTAERNSGWGFLSDLDSPNDSLATGNSALTNSSGAFGEVAFDMIDFAAYTDISNPSDCRK